MAATGVAGLLETLELREQQAGVGNGIDADIITATVRGTPGKGDFDPREPTVGRTNCETCRLGYDDRVRRDSVLEECPGAEAFVFLVDHGGHHNPVVAVRLHCQKSRGAHRGDAALHVSGTATVKPIAPQLRIEGVVRHALDADYIEVAVEHESRRVDRAEAGNDVGPTRPAIEQSDVEAPIVEDR